MHFGKKQENSEYGPQDHTQLHRIRRQCNNTYLYALMFLLNPKKYIFLEAAMLSEVGRCTYFIII